MLDNPLFFFVISMDLDTGLITHVDGDIIDENLLSQSFLLQIYNGSCYRYFLRFWKNIRTLVWTLYPQHYQQIPSGNVLGYPDYYNHLDKRTIQSSLVAGNHMCSIFPVSKMPLKTKILPNKYAYNIIFWNYPKWVWL